MGKLSATTLALAAFFAAQSVAFAQCKQGRLVKAPEPDKTIWVLAEDGRYGVATWSTFRDACKYDYKRVETLQAEAINAAPLRGIIAANGSFMRYTGTDTIYYIENGKRRPIVGWNTFVALGGPATLQGDNITIQDASLMGFMPEGEPIRRVEGGSGGTCNVCWPNPRFPGGVECKKC